MVPSAANVSSVPARGRVPGGELLDDHRDADRVLGAEEHTRAELENAKLQMSHENAVAAVNAV